METVKLSGIKLNDFKVKRQVSHSNLRYGKVLFYVDADPDG